MYARDTIVYIPMEGNDIDLLPTACSQEGSHPLLSYIAQTGAGTNYHGIGINSQQNATRILGHPYHLCSGTCPKKRVMGLIPKFPILDPATHMGCDGCYETDPVLIGSASVRI